MMKQVLVNNSCKTIHRKNEKNPKSEHKNTYSYNT